MIELGSREKRAGTEVEVGVGWSRILDIFAAQFLRSFSAWVLYNMLYFFSLSPTQLLPSITRLVLDSYSLTSISFTLYLYSQLVILVTFFFLFILWASGFGGEQAVVVCLGTTKKKLGLFTYPVGE
jgi:hypothetical protein